MAAVGSLPIALTIAGSDSSGGAGIQADLKTFSAFGVYGASVITALTAQNTQSVDAIMPVSESFITAQFESVMRDLAVSAIKTGMLGDEATVACVVGLLKTARVPIVVDPVMVATSGDLLLEEDAVSAVRDTLLPLATLVTPNLHEAAKLLQTDAALSVDEMKAQAHALLVLGCKAVLLKGGHGGSAEAIDVLAMHDADGIAFTVLSRPRVATMHTHGTGCTLSAAVAAGLAEGKPLVQSVSDAKSFVWGALTSGATRRIGQGNSPVDHHFQLRAGNIRSED